MDNKNMTALFSLFVKVYHHKEKNIKIYDDKYSEFIIENMEYDNIINNLYSGINFFNPNFSGTKEEAVKWIVNKQLGPSVLGRCAFNKRSLDNAIVLGCKQYVIYVTGYDTSALNYDINTFEIDYYDMILDKKKRLKSLDTGLIKYIESDLSKNEWKDKLLNNGYNPNIISHNSLLGISYYLDKNSFYNLIKSISTNICLGSSILFDYQTLYDSVETLKNELLAEGANEKMKAKYSYDEINLMLSNNGFEIYEHLDSKSITEQFFYDYNTLNPDCTINAPIGIEYVLAIKIKKY